MSYKDRVARMKKSLVQRHEEAYKSKDEGATTWGTIFHKDKIKGLPFWKVGEGTHEIDVIPFFAGPDMPGVKDGEAVYKADMWVHLRIGAINENYVCPLKNFNKPCPICEYIDKHDLSKEEWAKVAPKRRTVFQIWVHDDAKEEEKGIQLWECAHFIFDMNVSEIAKAAPAQGGIEAWTDLEEGKSVVFTRKGTGKDNTKFYGHRLADRRQQIPEDIINQTIDNLDDYIKMHPDYDEIADIFYGGQRETSEEPDAGDGEQPERPSRQEESDCPVGAAFGHDFNQYQECDDCPVYDDCMAENNKMTKPEPEPEPEPEPTKPTPRTQAPTPRRTLPRRRR